MKQLIYGNKLQNMLYKFKSGCNFQNLGLIFIFRKFLKKNEEGFTSFALLKKKKNSS